METNDIEILTLEGFARRSSNRKLKLTFICCGQYGGRQGDEFKRLGHEAIAVNTSESDLSDLEYIKGNNVIKLDGYNGAVKDIQRGQAAIKDNKSKILNMLKRPEIKEADFVFVIAGMGGGTGNAAAPIILSNLPRVRTPFNGKPSFGAILSVPGSWEKRGIKKNARWGLSHIQDLVSKKVCGSVCLIDNEKLYKITEALFEANDNKLEWTDYGNTSLASLLTEIAISTSLPSSRTFDEDEFLDVCSTPGFVSWGKVIIPNSVQFNHNTMKQLIIQSFNQSPTASDYDYDIDAVNGFIAIVHPDKKEFINESTFRSFEEIYGEFIANAEKPHAGFIANHEWNKINTIQAEEHKQENAYAILYTGAVCSRLPKRIIEMLKEIEQEEKELEERKLSRTSETLDLSQFMEIEKVESDTANLQINEDFDLFSDAADEQSAADELDDLDWGNIKV